MRTIWNRCARGRVYGYSIFCSLRSGRIIRISARGCCHWEGPDDTSLVYISVCIVLIAGGRFLYQFLDTTLDRLQTSFAKKVATFVKINPAPPAPQETSRPRSTQVPQKVQPTISTYQMEAIKEVDNFINGRSEGALREAFGFQSMMNRNIQMVRDSIISYKTGRSDFNYYRYHFPEGTALVTGEHGEVQRRGGALQLTLQPNQVSFIYAPREFMEGQEILRRFETSSQLPSSIIAQVKDFDTAVGGMATISFAFWTPV